MLKRIWNDNKEGIIIVAAAVIIFNIGYGKGFGDCQRAVTKALKEAYDLAKGLGGE